ncbi:hypothetical protein BCT81_10815 [Vibrio sp. 10N.261.52.A1]|nr:hypothetical protein BCT81_10815 [Vibrio sp. 10N.261.52.A1]
MSGLDFRGIEKVTTNLVVDLMTVKQVTLSTAGYYHLFNHALRAWFFLIGKKLTHISLEVLT